LGGNSINAEGHATAANNKDGDADQDQSIAPERDDVKLLDDN
jgi:hypothetical protein